MRRALVPGYVFLVATRVVAGLENGDPVVRARAALDVRADRAAGGRLDGPVEWFRGCD